MLDQGLLHDLCCPRLVLAVVVCDVGNHSKVVKDNLHVHIAIPGSEALLIVGVDTALIHIPGHHH